MAAEVDEKGKKKVTVPVRIMGESFLITGAGEEEYVLSLAKELDTKLSEARRLMPTASSNRIAISVALELVSQLRSEKERAERLLETIERT